jgi:two-component system LytT family sensor kinase
MQTTRSSSLSIRDSRSRLARRRGRSEDQRVRLRSHRLWQLGGLAFLIATIWTFLGVFFASQAHAIATARGYIDDVDERAIHTISTCIVWALLTPLVIYIADRLPLRAPHRARKIALLVVIAIVVAGLRAIIDAAIPGLLKNQPLSADEFRDTVVAVLHLHFLFFAVIVGVVNFVRARAEADDRARRGAHVDAELAQAQLRRLRTDLQPHFLFNTLNAVTALVHTDPRAAEETIDKLIELLRASMEVGDHTEVPLAEELDFVGRYLDLQKVRFGDRLRPKIHIADPELLRAQVPPLVLQPLVENSIVHGIRKRPAGGEIEVFAFRDGDTLQLEVSDSGPGCDLEAPFSGVSIGVPHTRARLEFLYHDPRALTFQRKDGRFIARVRIPLRYA